MDFDFTDREEAFRKEVRGWLEANLPDDLRGRAFASSRADREEVRKLRAWQKRMCEAGYVGLDWPREFGGRGATIIEMVILYQEMARAESPQLVNRGGVSMLAPPLIRQKLAGLWIGEQALQLNGYRSLTNILRGGAPGPEGSTSKLFWSQIDQELAHVATEVIGPYAQIAHGSSWAPDEGQWEFYELLARASGIRAGTSEILRNILAEIGRASCRE